MAKQNLDECLFVGLTERFQDSVFLMAYVFGWFPIADYQSLRVASKRSRKEDVPPNTLDAIAHANQLDLALYEYGRERFQRDYARMVHELHIAYGQPRKEECDRLLSETATPEECIDLVLSPLKLHYERCYAENPPEQPVKIYDFNCLQPIHGSGWHRRNGKKNGAVITDTPFRWTGPGAVSTMDLALQPGEDLVFRIHILNAIAPDVLNSLSIHVNGHPMPLSPLEKGTTSGIFQGVIAREWLQSDRPFTRLEFHVNRTATPNSINPENSDKRLVGLAVHRIQIFPVAIAIATHQFDYTAFPDDDSLWIEVVEFLTPRLQVNERLVAKVEFSKKFPRQFCSFIESFQKNPDVNWVIVHKGEYQAIDPVAFSWVMRTLKPVFANRVFVVFSKRSDVAAISFWSTHVLTLHGRIWTHRLTDMGFLSPKAKKTITALARVILAPLRSPS